MNVIFGTTERHTALGFIQKALPSKNLTEETAKPLLDLVSAGKIRVGDPYMYGNAPIYPETGFGDDDKKILTDWYTSLGD